MTAYTIRYNSRTVHIQSAAFACSALTRALNGSYGLTGTYGMKTGREFTSATDAHNAAHEAAANHGLKFCGNCRKGVLVPAKEELAADAALAEMAAQIDTNPELAAAAETAIPATATARPRLVRAAHGRNADTYTAWDAHGNAYHLARFGTFSDTGVFTDSSRATSLGEISTAELNRLLGLPIYSVGSIPHETQIVTKDRTVPFEGRAATYYADGTPVVCTVTGETGRAAGILPGAPFALQVVRWEDGLVGAERPDEMRRATSFPEAVRVAALREGDRLTVAGDRPGTRRAVTVREVHYRRHAPRVLFTDGTHAVAASGAPDRPGWVLPDAVPA